MSRGDRSPRSSRPRASRSHASFPLRALVGPLAVLVLLLASPARAEPDALGADERALRERLHEVLRRHHVPGMAVALVDRGGVRWTTGIGKSNVAAGTEATVDTLFRVASISKVWLALSILKLEAEGKVSLDAPVAGLVPEVPLENPWEATHPVRLVHLLENTSGWDDLSLRAFAPDPTRSSSRPASLREALDLTRGSRVSRWRPGTSFAYDNAGPAVTAAIVEKASGLRYEDYVAATFFAPLGMESATFLPTGDSERRLTRLYRVDGKTEVPYWHMLVRPAAALDVSAGDMSKLLLFLLNRGVVGNTGRALLPASALARMESPATSFGAEAGLVTGYGLHNQALQDGGFVWRGHRGGFDGASADLFYLPTEGVGYFCALNADADDAFQEIGRLLRAHLVRDRVPPRPPPPPSATTARDYAGWYELASLRHERARYRARLFQLARVEPSDEGLRVRGRAGHAARGDYLPVSPVLYRRPHESAASLALASPVGEGRLVLTPTATMRRLSAFDAWSRIGATVLALAALASVLLFAAFWLPRLLLGRMKGAKHLYTRVWPLAATLALGVGHLLESLGDPARLGRPTPWALSLTACTVLFPVLSCVSLVALARVPRREVSVAVYVHTALVSFALVGIAAYLASWGVVGLRTWR